MPKIKIAFISVPTTAGEDLLQSFKHLLEDYPDCELSQEKTYANAKLSKIAGIQRNLSQADFIGLYAQADLVIFDATIDSNGLHNYAAWTVQAMLLDHILVVSRNYVPVNFFGFRSGGIPTYPNPYSGSSGISTNKQIIAWLRQQIEDILLMLPRPDNEKGLIGVSKAMLRSLQSKPSPNTRVFLSYRSSDLLNANTPATDTNDVQQNGEREIGKKLELLKRNVAHGQYPSVQPGTELRFVPPGQLAYPNEILTEYRRWQVLTTIDTMWIRKVDEVWIYNTEQYLNSWWTQGELALLSWRFADGLYCPKLRLFSPQKETLSDLPSNFLLPMTAQQRKNMKRIMSVSDPATTAPEYIRALHGKNTWPIVGMLPFTSGHQWSDDFWLNPLLPCDCRKPDAATLHSKQGLDTFLNISYEIRLTPQSWARQIQSGSFTCNHCGSRYVFREMQPRYLWMPTRQGITTGLDGASLISLPTYRMIRHS